MDYRQMKQLLVRHSCLNISDLGIKILTMRFTNQLVLLLSGVLCSLSSFAQITVTNTQTPTQLVQNVLIGSGIVASNITFNGTTAGANAISNTIGYFQKGTSTFPMNAGVVIGTGNVNSLPGAGSVFQSSTTGGGSDPDLVAISGVPNIYDAAVLEFDFVAVGDSMTFRYMFGSEEYEEFVGGGVNDAFGFFISGPGITGTFTGGTAANLAIIPGTSTFVSINSVNQNTSPTLCGGSPCYHNNEIGNFYGTSSVLDGYTTLLMAVSSLQCGGTYHIKLAIGDGGDSVYDSAVFLEANSFSSNSVTIQTQGSLFSGSFTDTILAENCTSTELLFIRPEWSIDTSQTFTITYSGTANPTADFTGLNGSVTFPIGVDTLVFTIAPVNDGIAEPMEWIQIKGYTISVCGDTLYDSVTLYVVDQYDLTYNLPDTLVVGCAPNQVPVFINNLAGSIPPYSYAWDFGSTTNPTLVPASSTLPITVMHYVTVTDGCGNDFVDSVALVHDVTPPNISISPNDTLYIKCMPNTVTPSVVLTAGASAPYNYVWSNGATGTSITISDNGINGEQIPFSVTVTDGCTNTATANGVVIVDQSLVIDPIISTPSNVCSSTGTVTGTVLGATTLVGPVNYAWTGPGPIGPNASTWSNVGSGWYYLTVTDDFCSAKDSVFVNTLPLPLAQFTATPSSGLAPLTVTFTNQSQNGITYYWDFGNGQTAVTTNTNSVTTTYTTEGDYIVQLIASQGSGCEDTAYLVIPVSVLYPPTWVIPNVFTPNKDNVNDVWFVETEFVEKIELVITNRWGNVMHESDSPFAAWNGKAKSGNLAEEGVYFYKIIFYGIDGSVTPAQGFIQLTK